MSEDETLPCDGKMRFDSKQEAEATSVVAEHQYGSKTKAYLCKHCELWHLSSA